MSEAQESPDDRRAVKVWLLKLRESAGYTQEDLAEMLGVSRKAIINTEKTGDSLPQGLTMVRYLRLLGVLADAPVAAPGIGRLAALEKAVDQLVNDVATGFQGLDRGIARIESRLPGEDGQDQGQCSTGDP